MSICCESVCVFVCLSVCHSLCLCVCLYLCLSICLCVFVRLCGCTGVDCIRYKDTYAGLIIEAQISRKIGATSLPWLDPVCLVFFLHCRWTERYLISLVYIFSVSVVQHSNLGCVHLWETLSGQEIYLCRLLDDMQQPVIWSDGDVLSDIHLHLHI